MQLKGRSTDSTPRCYPPISNIPLISHRSRSLSQFAALPNFPYGSSSCKDSSPASSPYSLVLASTQYALSNGVQSGSMCFSISSKTWSAPDSQRPACYNLLESSIHALSLYIQPACAPSLDVNQTGVFLNGKKMPSSAWDTRAYATGGALTIRFEQSGFKLNKNKVDNEAQVICIKAIFPCNSPSNFFATLPVKYTFFESTARQCCPALQSL